MSEFNLFSLVEGDNEITKENSKEEVNGLNGTANELKTDNSSTVEESIKESTEVTENIEQSVVTELEQSAEEVIDQSAVTEDVEQSTEEVVEKSVVTEADQSVDSNDGYSPLSLFEDLSAKADLAEAEREEKIKVAKAAKEKKDKDKEKKEPTAIDSGVIPVNEETKIHIYHEMYNITDFFTLEEITDGVQIKNADDVYESTPITTEMVRAKLAANGYPHFVEGFTQCVFHVKQNMIVPVAIAKKKGCSPEVEVNSSITDDFTSFLNQTGKRIPFSLFSQFVALAKMFMKLNLEVRAEFYYNHTLQEFLLHIPQQTCHKYWVTSNEAPGEFQLQMLDKGEIVELVCEIHSHHTLEAFPSSTDNESERYPNMTYIIVGALDQPQIQVYSRVFEVNGTHKKLSFNQVIEPCTNNSDLSYTMLPRFKANQVTIVR